MHFLNSVLKHENTFLIISLISGILSFFLSFLVFFFAYNWLILLIITTFIAFFSILISILLVINKTSKIFYPIAGITYSLIALILISLIYTYHVCINIYKHLL